MRRIALAATALLVAVSAEGCQTVHPSAPGSLAPPEKPRTVTVGYSYSGGRAVQTLSLPPATVQPAVLSALDDLRVEKVRTSNREGGVIAFDGTTADGRKAGVTLRPHPAGTRLSARFGFFGNEPLTRALLDRVGVRLGTLPPAAIPTEIPSEPASNPYFSRSAVPDSVMFKDMAEAPYRDSPVP